MVDKSGVFYAIVVLVHSFKYFRVISGETSNAVIEGNIRFAGSTYLSLAKSGEVDMLFSPAGLYLMLSLVYMGARGSTAAHLAQSLNLPNNRELIKNAIHEMMLSMSDMEDSIMSIRNKIFVDKGIHIETEFKAIAEKTFVASIRNIDFKNGDPDDIVNKWTSDVTRRKIGGFIWDLHNELSKRIIFINAMTFQGKWLHKFNPAHTKMDNFFTGGFVEMVPMMNVENYFKMVKNTKIGAHILELPYDQEADSIVFVIILPVRREGLRRVEEKLRQRSLSDVTDMSQVVPRRVKVSLPRFRNRDFVDVSREMSEDLDLGAIFEGRSDLSGLTRDPVYVSRVYQETALDVTEQGTFPSAASSVFSGSHNTGDVAHRGADPSYFIANHPFIYLIQSKRTGNILFLGKCSNPAY